MEVNLKLMSGKTAGEAHSIPAGEQAAVGRADDCDFQVTGDGISRHHCLIENKGDRVLLTDLDSHNGTTVNGQPVVSCYLQDGDRVGIGAAMIEARLAGGAAGRAKRGAALDLAREDTAAEVHQRVVDIDRTILVTALRPKAEDLVQAHAALRTLYHVGEAINAEHDLRRLFSAIIDSVLAATGAERAALLIHDPATGSIEPVAAKRRDGGEGLHLKVSRTVVGEVLRKGVSARSTDASADDRFKDGPSVITQKIRSVMCVPLASRNTILGALYVDTTDERHKFGDRDLELLATIGAQAGVAVERTRLIEDLEDLFIGAIRALVASVEARDPYTRGHSERVTAYALAMSDVLGLDAQDREIVELAGLLHDVGKIGVPGEVLHKPGKLTDDEYAVIKLHPVQGEDIVRNIQHHYIGAVADAVRHHHERWDGGGYADGQHGDELSPVSRVLAVADAYDAMTSDRPYRKGYSPEKATGILEEVAGTQLDPESVRAFVKAQEDGAIAEAAKAGEPTRKSKYASTSRDPDTATQDLPPDGED